MHIACNHVDLCGFAGSGLSAVAYGHGIEERLQTRFVGHHECSHAGDCGVRHARTDAVALTLRGAVMRFMCLAVFDDLPSDKK